MTTTLTTLHEADRPLLVRPADVPPMGPRLGALAVDQLLVVVCCAVTTGVWLALGGDSQKLLAVWLLTGLLVETGQAFAEAVSGATLGGALTHIRTVSARTGWPAGLVAVVVRRLVLAAGGVVLPVLGAYVVAGSGEWNRSPTRRGWHDWAADTLVLRDWAVPDQDERAAERAVRQAARLSDASGSSGDVPTSEAEPGVEEPGADLAGSDAEPRAVVPTSGEVPVVDLASDTEPSDDPAASDTEASLDAPTSVDEEPLDHRTATTVDVRPAGRASTPEPAGAESADEPALGLTSVVPIVVPDLRAEPEPEPEHPRARHRATTLGLGRPRPYTSAGRHRIPEIPTQRTSPRASAGWPQLTDDAEPTAPGGGLRLVFDCGVCVEVVGSGAVGRDLTGVLPPPVHPVVVDDPKRTVSRVHLRFGLNPGQDALWVMDENSTNGTILVRPDGGARVLPAGVPAVVAAGWQIRFGERSAVVERSVIRRSTPSTDPVERVSHLDRAGLFRSPLDGVPVAHSYHFQLSEASSSAAE